MKEVPLKPYVGASYIWFQRDLFYWSRRFNRNILPRITLKPKTSVHVITSVCGWGFRVGGCGFVDLGDWAIEIVTFKCHRSDNAYLVILSGSPYYFHRLHGQI